MNFEFTFSNIRFRFPAVLTVIAALVLAFGLKYHYSNAGSDELDWILAPTASLVELARGIPFEKESGTGYVNREWRVIIAPGCAGVNFMIIAFCMAVFRRIHIIKNIGGGLFRIIISAVNAWGLAVGANALRIVISIFLYEADIYGGWFTPENVHRLTGICIYIACLYLFHFLIKLDKTGKNPGRQPAFIRKAASCLAPLCWYFAVTIGVPLLNAAFRGNVFRFANHCGVVISAGMVVFLLVFLVQWISGNVKRSLGSLWETI